MAAQLPCPDRGSATLPGFPTMTTLLCSAAVKFRETPLSGAVIVELEPHADDRGFFARTYCDREFAAAGLPTTWPQCNLSRNRRSGTLRGMHFNAPPHEEAKLVRCASGAIWDVIVDIRPGSPTRLRWFGLELS